MTKSSEILKEYDQKIDQYVSAGKEIQELLEKSLKKSKLKFLPLQSRPKDKRSLEMKIQSNKYQCLSDLTDIFGIRVILFQNPDIDKVKELIKKSFDVDDANSHDKRQKSPNEFGYNSAHSIVSLKPNASHSKLSDFKVEIQIRTVLQHAWAEFSHELGYKNKKNVPANFLRDINRISALLEVGDREFERLRLENIKYIKNIGKEIEKGAYVEVNQASLKSFVLENEYMKRVADGLKRDYKIKFVDSSSNYTEIIDRFAFLGIDDVNYIKVFLEKEYEHFFRFVDSFFKVREKVSVLPNNATLFYLCHFIAASKGKGVFNDYHTFKNYKIVTKIDLYELYNKSRN